MDEKDLQQDIPVVIEEDNEYEELLRSFEVPVESEKIKKNHKILRYAIPLMIFVLLTGAAVAISVAPKPQTTVTEPTEPVGPAEIIAETNANKIWQVQPVLDENGEIKNGVGTLIEQVPANIEKMDIKNTTGSYTIKAHTPTQVIVDEETGAEKVTSSSTVYTLAGYEGFDLQEGNPDQIANCLSTITFNKIIHADATDCLADYGLDNPRAVATVTYTNGTKAILRIGNDAVQGLGTYFAYGDNNTVYITDTDKLTPLLGSTTDLISLTINNSAADSENAEFEYIQLSGQAYGETITLKMNKDESVNEHYMMITPTEALADNTAASAVTGAVRGLYADSVVCINPDDKDIKKYKLNSNYARLVAKYPDLSVNLIAGQPDDEGNCYLMKDGGKVIYKISAESIPWITATADSLTSSYVLSPDYQSVSYVTVKTDKEYVFKVITKATVKADSDGEVTETVSTKVKYNNSKLTSGHFETYFDNMAYLKKCDMNKETPTGDPVLTITYDYSTQRSNDVVQFYPSSGGKHIVTINSKPIGHVYSSYVEKLIKYTPEIAENEQISSFW